MPISTINFKAGIGLCLVITSFLAVPAPRVQAQEAGEESPEVAKAGLTRLSRIEAAVNELTLEDKPTLEQCRDYIKHLDSLAKQLKEQGGSGALMALHGKLDGIPAEYVDVLVEARVLHYELDVTARIALEKLDLDPGIVRQRIVEHPDRSPANIGVIVKNGWCEDAKEAIVKRVLSADKTLDRTWFNAAVELKDPRLYAKLHEATVASDYAYERLEMLKAIPDYDLLYTIRSVLKRVENQGVRLKVHHDSGLGKERYLHFLAAENGDIQSLAELISDLPKQVELSSGYSTPGNPRLPVIKLIDFKGSNLEIRAWFEANRDKLVFDSLSRRFILPEE